MNIYTKQLRKIIITIPDLSNQVRIQFVWNMKHVVGVMGEDYYIPMWKLSNIIRYINRVGYSKHQTYANYMGTHFIYSFKDK